MNSIKRAITENTESDSGKMVSVNLGELRELAFIIRDQGLTLGERLNEIIKEDPRVDIIDAKQTEFRLRELYRQITGIKL